MKVNFAHPNTEKLIHFWYVGQFGVIAIIGGQSGSLRMSDLVGDDRRLLRRMQCPRSSAWALEPKIGSGCFDQEGRGCFGAALDGAAGLHWPDPVNRPQIHRHRNVKVFWTAR